jgi:hypothetical protein
MGRGIAEQRQDRLLRVGSGVHTVHGRVPAGRAYGCAAVSRASLRPFPGVCSPGSRPRAGDRPPTSLLTTAGEAERWRRGRPVPGVPDADNKEIPCAPMTAPDPPPKC